MVSISVEDDVARALTHYAVPSASAKKPICERITLQPTFPRRTCTWDEGTLCSRMGSAMVKGPRGEVAVAMSAQAERKPQRLLQYCMTYTPVRGLRLTTGIQ